MCHFWAKNDPFVLNKIFLVQIIIITFIYLLALFIVQNLKELLQQIQSYEDVPFFGSKMVHLPQTFFFSLENYLYNSHLPISPFHCAKIFKNFFQWIQSCEDAQFLGTKWFISPNEIFFTKSVNKPCFFHSCLSTCQKSKSDIHLLMKYWPLIKNTEISLAESHFWL